MYLLDTSSTIARRSLDDDSTSVRRLIVDDVGSADALSTCSGHQVFALGNHGARRFNSMSIIIPLLIGGIGTAIACAYCGPSAGCALGGAWFCLAGWHEILNG